MALSFCRRVSLVLVLGGIWGGPVGAQVDQFVLQEGLRADIGELAAYQSRLPGYPGARAAANWLEGRLRAMGVDSVYRQAFPVPVPIDEGFQLHVDGVVVPLHGMWPNLARSPSLPPGGVGGPLIYAGDGNLALVEGRSLQGGIVLLDYASGDSWSRFFHLGARAVIFLEQPGHRWEAALKYLDVPADLPRLYAAGQVAQQLRQWAAAGQVGQLSGRMSWQRAEGENIVAIIEGRDPELADEAIWLTAYYDSMSPVPALAPGAEQACGAAALLALLEGWRRRPPARTVVAVWTSGHFENLAGMRHLVPLLQRAAGRRGDGNAGNDTLGLRQHLGRYQTRFLVGLDLSSGSSVLGAFKPVAPYRISLLVPPLTELLMNWSAAFADSLAPGRPLLANGLKPDQRRRVLGGLPLTVPFDAAAAALAGCPALVFCTANDNRVGIDSPLDLPADVDWARLGQQVELLAYLAGRLVETAELPDWAWGKDAFGTLRGEVVHYGRRSYLPDQPTAGALVRVRLRNPPLAGVRGDFWALADSLGRFAVPGIESGLIYTQPVRVEAYGLDPLTGAVIQAPDWGLDGEGRLPGRALKVQMDALDEEVQIVTAAGVGTTLFEIFDPRRLQTLERLQVLDAERGVEPTRFGATLPLTPVEAELFSYRNRVGSWVRPAAVVFTPLGTRLQAILGSGEYGLDRRLLLLNGDDRQPEGRGYEVKGEQRLVQTAYRTGADLQQLNDYRLARLEAHGVRNGRLDYFQTRSRDYLAAAGQARDRGYHQTFLDQVRRAWAYGTAAYGEIERTRRGVVQGAVFLLASLLPFAHFAERLLVGAVSLRGQILGFFAFFALGFALLRRVHPAFEMAISPWVILLGFVILSLSILVTSLGVGRLNRQLRQLVGRQRGQGETGRGNALPTAFAVGVGHMRRRPLRTGLTAATLALLTFSVLSFTSIRSSLHTNWVELAGEVPYEGVLIRRPGWQALEVQALQVLVDRFGSHRVAPRAWLETASALRLERDDIPGRATLLTGLVGLSPDEIGLVAPQRGLIAGRWLAAGEQDACLLPQSLAADLGIVPDAVAGARVRLGGEVWRVVGLLADGALEAPDLNGEPLTPLDPDHQQPVEAAVGGGLGQVPPVFSHLDGALVAVVPYRALMRWEGARLTSVGILLEGDEWTELAEMLDLNLYAGYQGRRYLVNTVGVTGVAGWADLGVPVAIAALIVLNTMLGAVYERSREIAIFNAVGLAPNHVSMLFMSEACAFAVLGEVVGYLLGQGLAQAAAGWGWLPGLELNYSSLGAVGTLGAVMGVVLLSALYPSYLAGRLCTPGIERRWRLPAPQGDTLLLRLPFSLQRREAEGMAAFLAEFWQGHQEESIGAGFYVEDLALGGRAGRLYLRGRIWLAPFDQGIVQETTLDLGPEQEGDKYWSIDIRLQRRAGDKVTWARLCRAFIDDVRRQFLVWRTLPEDQQEAYRQQANQWKTG